MSSQAVTHLYRAYIDYQTNTYTEPYIQYFGYKVIKATKCGWWIEYHNAKGKKFVSMGEGKRFAHPTIELAMQGLVARKHSHMRHIMRQYKEVAGFLNAFNCCTTEHRVGEHGWLGEACITTKLTHPNGKQEPVYQPIEPKHLQLEEYDHE